MNRWLKILGGILGTLLVLFAALIVLTQRSAVALVRQRGQRPAARRADARGLGQRVDRLDDRQLGLRLRPVAGPGR